MYISLNRDVAQEKRQAYEYKLCQPADYGKCVVDTYAKGHLKNHKSIEVFCERTGTNLCEAHFRKIRWILGDKDDDDDDDKFEKDESNLNHFSKPCRLNSNNCLTMLIV